MLSPVLPTVVLYHLREPADSKVFPQGMLLKELSAVYGVPLAPIFNTRTIWR